MGEKICFIVPPQARQCQSPGENPDCFTYSPIVLPLCEYIFISKHLSTIWS